MKFTSWAAVGRWVAKLVARLLATTALWVQISQKYKMGDISKGVATHWPTHSSPPQKNIYKRNSQAIQ
jgi:hypothetical protein